MTFPKKFKKRLELDKGDVTSPNKAWITYAVCGCEKDSCGWEGWILESAYRKTGKKKQQLYIDDRQQCPECGKQMFRTGVQFRFTLDKNQTPDLIPGVDYKVARMKYE